MKKITIGRNKVNKKIIIVLIIGILLIPIGIPIASIHSNKDLCSLNINICEKVCGGELIERCTTDIPPSVCETVCLR